MSERVKNPTDRILGKGVQAMMDALQEEMSNIVNRLLRDAISPEMLADMLKAIGGTGMDFSHLAGMVGQQPGFDPYKVLGLDRSASDEEVKRRYHELLHKLHPDTAGTAGTEFLFQCVRTAFETMKKERGWP